MKKFQPESFMTTAAIAAGALVLLGFLLLFPAAMRMKRLDRELAAAAGEIAGVEAVFGGAESLGREVFRIQQELAGVEKKVYSREKPAGIVNLISAEARRMNVEIVSLRPEEPKTALDEKGNPLTLDGRAARILPLRLELEGTYENLGDYLAGLEQKLPVLFTIDGLTLEMKNAEELRLRANVLLSACALEQ